jgi:hypothetical protein
MGLATNTVLQTAISMCILAALGIPAATQSRYFGLRTIRKEGDFRFPVLTLHRSQRVETKINQFLQLSELWTLANPGRSNLFDQITINDGGLYGRKVGLSYEIFANSRTTFSIGFYNSMGGATTHWWSAYYNFNAQNGDRISLSDLFSESGYKRFLDHAKRKRSSAYKTEVARKVHPADREALLGVLSSIDADDLSDFSIGPGTVTIHGENLLGKSLCCENLNMDVVFKLREFQRWLNEYGRIVFRKRSGNLSKFRSNQLPQLFRGTADGTSPFAAVFALAPLNRVEGMYAYLKYHRGIRLEGEIKGTEIQLTEQLLVEKPMVYETNSNHRWVEGGTISGTFDSFVLTATRTDKIKQRSVTFAARRD